MGAVGSPGRVFSAEHEVLNARSPRDREVPSFNGTRGRPEHELHNGSTRLTRQEIAVLVRVDGRLTLNEILRAVPPEAQSTFLDVFRSLRDRRLVSPPMPDAFALQWPAALEEPPSAADGAQADAGLKVLQRRGFYVQIAREGVGLRDPSARTSKAVVIDDDPMFARFTVTLLSLSGFQVHQAGDRASIVAALRKLPMPDVVLLDVQRPDLDGLDVLRSVRAHAVLKHVPGIMLTGEATRQAVLKGIHAGADGYITKPAEPDAVVRAVQTVLGLQQSDVGASPWGHARHF